MNNVDVGDLKRTLPSVDSWLAILAMEKSGDLVNAAKSLGVTQPALSFHLKKLEEQMGFTLFSFSGKRKVLTKIGQAYVEELKVGLQTLHDAHDKVLKAASELSHQKLRVAGRRELLVPLLPFPFPGKIELLQTTSADAMKALRDHQVDLAISVRPLDSNDLLAKLFFESGFKIIAPKTWKLRNLEWESLRTKPVIAYGNHQAYLEEYLKWKQVKIKDLTVSRVVEDWFSVVELVRHGLGWAVIPEAWGIHTDQVEVRHLHAHELEKQKVFLFYRKEDRKSAWIRALSDWLALIPQ
jgi:DNA-binding transcriptional LysR family regulator